MVQSGQFMQFDISNMNWEKRPPSAKLSWARPQFWLESSREVTIFRHLTAETKIEATITIMGTKDGIAT
jgi:hypothetical protein